MASGWTVDTSGRLTKYPLRVYTSSTRDSGRFFNFELRVTLDEDYHRGEECPIRHDGTEGLYIKVYRESARQFHAYCHYKTPVKPGQVKYLIWQGTGVIKAIQAHHGSFASVLNKQLVSLDCWELGCDYKPRNMTSVKGTKWRPY